MGNHFHYYAFYDIPPCTVQGPLKKKSVAVPVLHIIIIKTGNISDILNKNTLLSVYLHTCLHIYFYCPRIFITNIFSRECSAIH